MHTHIYTYINIYIYITQAYKFTSLFGTNGLNPGAISTVPK